MTDRTDTFNRANTTGGGIGTPSDSGSAWVQQSGTWDIDTNTASCAGENQATCVLESSVSNVEVQATMTAIGGNCGLVSRAADDNNYILAAVTPTAATIYKRVAGTFFDIGSYSGAFSNGDVLKLKSDSSSVHTLYQNGTVRITTSAESAGSTNTKHGIRTHTDSAARFNDFSIAEIGTAGSAALSGSASSSASGTQAPVTSIALREWVRRVFRLLVPRPLVMP